ncbi:hypothetical protein GBA65_15470 [Rubrobacter marinus]|uniref:Uncharacterized protein n=1 Tax=Rubrobacter marinus TaxID=2653852 RepID=A0A6G8PZR4_9ACTN|nr:hypothetical protein [Rubrobacter marinus]QIN79696.1 hypothetical protein GBA65_15470 [Rubrobacter marinus]
MRHTVAVSGAVCFALFLLAGCGGPTTPDTEGQTLTRAVQALADSGVADEDITVVAAEGGAPARRLTDLGTELGDPDELYVCDQDPTASPRRSP